MKLAEYFFSDYLEKKEKIQHIVHQDFIVIVPELIRTGIFGFGIPFAIWFFFPQLWIVSLIWAFFGLGRFLMNLYVWYYDVWLVTDRAVLDIKSSNIFDVSTTRIEYHMIEGISYTISGFWHTVLNYGDLMLEKVGSGTPVTLKNASNPAKAESTILKCQEYYMDAQVAQDHKTLRNLLSGMVREHVKQHGIPETDD